MFEQAIKWWNTLSEAQKIRHINKWKKMPNETYYGHYKEWDNKSIANTPAVFDMIYKDLCISQKSNKKI